MCLECPISKLKYVFSSSLKGLSNDVFRLEFCDWSNLAKPKVAVFSQNQVLWELSLRVYNLSFVCPVSILKYTFSCS